MLDVEMNLVLSFTKAEILFVGLVFIIGISVLIYLMDENEKNERETREQENGK